MPQKSIHIGLGSRAYDILIGTNLLADLGALSLPVAQGRHAFVVTDDVIAPLYLPHAASSLESAGFRVGSFIVPAGEGTKQFITLQDILAAMARDRVERTSLVIALGGGVVGDVAGFAASIFLRGIDVIQVPTTLLSQVDSAVGGKTGINTDYGKNTIGTFHQPRRVVIDTSVLGSLPRRHILSGYAELAKYGLIRDAAFWSWLESHGPRIVALQHEAVEVAIEACCRHKAALVIDDEHDQAGTRALLNLGHTFAHAMEHEAGYTGRLLHGEAVALGLVMAFDLSVRMGLCSPSEAQRIRTHLKNIGFERDVWPRVRTLSLDPYRLLARMRADKKTQNGHLTCVLAKGIGQAYVHTSVEAHLVHDVLHDFVRHTADNLPIAFSG